MGFRPEVPIYKLNFDEKTKWGGLQVRMESAPVGLLMDVARWSEEIDKTDGVQRVLLVEKMLTEVSGCLVSWNVEDRAGEPVPCDLSGLRRQPLDMVIQIVSAWVSAVADVPAPLVKASTNGSRLAGLPIETLSPDLVS